MRLERDWRETGERLERVKLARRRESDRGVKRESVARTIFCELKFIKTNIRRLRPLSAARQRRVRGVRCAK